MNAGARFGGAMALFGMLAACATTGDPRQGGLFGWSETQARERQSERQASIAGAQAELAGENARRREIESRNSAAERDIGAAKLSRESAESQVQAQASALVAKTERLENESPTPAMASRARSYRLRVSTVAAQTALSAADRSARLRGMEAGIDAALVQVQR